MKYMHNLQIQNGVKAVPYGGTGIARESDGHANFGFRNLKGHTEKLKYIPEIQDDEALASLVATINRSETGVLTIGCFSGPVPQDERGFSISGYIEFAFDSRAAIADAQRYFFHFFHFDRYLKENSFDEPMSLAWVLAGAQFHVQDGSSFHGFTASIFLNTNYFDNQGAAWLTWRNSLMHLEQYLGSIPIFDDGQPLELEDSPMLGNP